MRDLTATEIKNISGAFSIPTLVEGWATDDFALYSTLIGGLGVYIFGYYAPSHYNNAIVPKPLTFKEGVVGTLHHTVEGLFWGASVDLLWWAGKQMLKG